MFYLYVIYMKFMNILRTGMNISISRIHIWLCYTLNGGRMVDLYIRKGILSH